MKICDLIKHLTDAVSIYGDHELKIRVVKDGDDLTFYESSSIDFEYNEILDIFVAEIEVYGFDS